MTRSYVPKFDPEFKAPAVDAGLRSLFLLARVLIPCLVDLNSRPDVLRQVVSRLGVCACDQFGKTKPDEDLDRAWSQFFNDANVRLLPSDIRQNLETASAKSLSLAETPEIVDEDLTSAHQRGHLLVKSILESNGLKSLFCEPASLVVAYDHEAKYYCAAASRLDKQIRWVHQPVSHSLYGALFPDLVIAHEYLSHLIPRNPRLDKSISEMWLIVALIQWSDENCEPSADRQWRRKLWFHLREALRKHLLKKNLLKDTREDQARLDGLEGVYEFAFLLYGRSQPTFWQLTGGILTLADIPGNEAKVLKLLEKMTAKGTEWLSKLTDGKWQKIEDLF